MLPDRWDRIQSVFLSTVDLPAAEQVAALDAECQNDSALRADVESLLASDRDGNAQAIRAAIENEAALLAGDGRTGGVVQPPMEGQQIGHWRLIRELGRGGMGTVYLAARADMQYESQAAVKLARPGLDMEFILRRFRRERQILARLEHPNITRMLDGGTTSDGIPYFVMEYVDGLWITRYVAEHQLSVEARIRLCIPVCAAIAYAHRNFVVHRDLKPGNILIDAAGVPKLLDFGVSKLLHSAPFRDQPGPEDTQGAAIMTPDYASPEQIQGDPVTAASDIYSLGVVMYELLTDTRPHRIESCTPLALERAICQDPVIPPSMAASGNAALARRLKGDLDNIVLRAMQKEPGRRYPSVENLAEDLQRFLDHRPVTARPDSAAYRIGKFIRRNTVSVALGAVGLLAALAGIFVAGQQAFIAHQRFQDVRKLATTFVFDVEDAVRPLPGSTRVRQLIARTGVEYLSNLSRHSAGDWSLKRELASAWLRIGIVQGGQDSSNLGDSGAALASFGNAGTLLDEVLRHDPSDAQAAVERMKVFLETSSVQWGLGRYQEAVTSAQAGLRTGESRPVPDQQHDEWVQTAGLLHLSLVRLRDESGDLAGAQSDAAAAGQLLHQAAEAKPENREAQLGLADLDARVGSLKATHGQLEDALVNFRSGVLVLEALCLRYPADSLPRRQLMFAYSHVGDTLGNPTFRNTGDSKGAFEAYRKMAGQAEFLYHADSADARALSDYGIALLRLGVVTPKTGPLRKETLQKSRTLLEQAWVRSPQNRTITWHMMWVATELTDYAAAIAIGEKALSSAPDDSSVLLGMMQSAVRPMAEEQARRGERKAALATLEHSLHWAAIADAAVPQRSAAFGGVARAWQTAGSVYAILAGGESGESEKQDNETARAWYARALGEWRKLEHERSLSSAYAAEMRAAVQALAPGGLSRTREKRP